MKKLILLLTLFSIGLAANARHLKGGWIQYEYLGPGSLPNTSSYKITIRQYLDCGSIGPQIDDKATLGIFDAGTNQLVILKDIDSVVNGSVILNKRTYSGCIFPKPAVCYLINKYETVVELTDNPAGYILAVQRCCRINGIENIINSGDVGVTYSNRIPGIINGISFRNNSSPVFAQKDTALICFKAPFTIDFGAIDKDLGDSLVYTFCNGLTGGTNAASSEPNGIGPKPTSPSAPPFTSVPYNTPTYTGTSPLGPSVVIDSKTGIISGKAPPITGEYVLSVCVLEFRNGINIGSTKKEIHVTVANCSISAADLKPAYTNCNDLTFSFFNESTATNIKTYLWTFGDTSSAASNVSTLPTPTHTYPDTGSYNLTLTVTSGNGSIVCVDSAKAIVKVYPGFTADFTVDSSCILNPYVFKDTSYSKFGKVTSWNWDLGEPTVTTDTSTAKYISYLYPTLGKKTVTLIASNTFGCLDTMVKVIQVIDKPSLYLPAKDTTICYLDTVQLEAFGTGAFTWSPRKFMNNTTLSNPTIFPTDTTMYYVSLFNKGCVNDDSIKVNVVKSISVKVGPDTIACLTDPIQLYAKGLGQKFTWKSSNPLEKVSSVRNPTVIPSQNPTGYYVTAQLGKRCFATDGALVKVYPYPVAIAARDTVLCFGSPLQLLGYGEGNKVVWSPANKLVGADSTNFRPFIATDTTTTYLLTARYLGTNACPKIITDTVKVTIVPKVNIAIGNDTVVVADQPLQLKIDGNVDSATTSFFWTPSIGLNNNKIRNPIATLAKYIDTITYIARASTPEGCYALDSMRVVVYKTPPDIFVPTAFTPNGDGLNDIEKPIPVGIFKLENFSVFNRLGQLLYSTSDIEKGWDGNYKGKPQQTGTYVYTVSGWNYLGQRITRKGTFVLIAK